MNNNHIITQIIIFLVHCHLLREVLSNESILNSGYEVEGLLVIPGLGRLDRLDTVVNNIKKLEPWLTTKKVNENNNERNSINTDNNDVKWDCIIYVYAPRQYPPLKDDYFWDKKYKNKVDYLSSKCDIIENPERRVTDHMKMVQPALIRRIYKYIFLLLDDCKIEATDDFRLDKFLDIMKVNDLTLASPRVINANKGGGQGFRTIMQALPPTNINFNSPGYVVSFVEIFAVIMTMDAYTLYWELLYPSINPYGWGYDFWYDHYAKLHSKYHKMGIISSFKVKHEQVMDDNGRTDKTKAADKWQSLVHQESFY